MTDDRTAIPEAVKREVRQRCGFGCVICGLPIYHYDHVVEWSEVKEHKAENLILLCPNHHQDKTSRRIDDATIARFNDSPFNLTKKWSSPHLHVAAGNLVEFRIGDSIFLSSSSNFVAISVSGKPVLSVSKEYGALLFDIHLTDQYGLDVLKVERGELRVAMNVWDYRVEGTRFQIRSEKGEIILSIRLEGGTVAIERGLFLRKGRGVLVSPNEIALHPGGPRIRSMFIEDGGASGGIFVD